MSEQLPSDQIATPDTDSRLQVRVDAMGESHQVVDADFARAQEREIADLKRILCDALGHGNLECAECVAAIHRATKT